MLGLPRPPTTIIIIMMIIIISTIIIIVVDLASDYGSFDFAKNTECL